MKSILFVTQVIVSVEMINKPLVDDELKEFADDNKRGGMILQW